MSVNHAVRQENIIGAIIERGQVEIKPKPDLSVITHQVAIINAWDSDVPMRRDSTPIFVTQPSQVVFQ